MKKPYMRAKILIKTIFLATLSSTIAPHLVAQNPPAKTYQPGFWQPIARVNTNRPVEINIINETDINIEYDLTANEDIAPQSILPGDTAIIRKFPIPAYFLINPKSSSTDTSLFNLQFNVSATNNIVKVRIDKVSQETPGDSTLNLHKTGGIYVY